VVDFSSITRALMAGKADEVKNLVSSALAENTDPALLINEALIPGMSTIGERFRKNEIYIPEVLIAARAMHAGLDILRPKLVEHKVEPVATIVLGTVKGDLHDIGKNLVGMMFEGAGFQVVDLGVDVAPEKYVASVQENNAQFLGLSALLTTTMPQMQSTISALKVAGIREQVKVLIGGAPVTQDYADKIGADGYSEDAASAVVLAKELLGA
jgi:5-methyltetrahydrofolate--homocysteine methyltransferase